MCCFSIRHTFVKSVYQFGDNVYQFGDIVYQFGKFFDLSHIGSHFSGKKKPFFRIDITSCRTNISIVWKSAGKIPEKSSLLVGHFWTLSNFVQICPKTIGHFIDNLPEIIGQNLTLLDTCRKKNNFQGKKNSFQGKNNSFLFFPTETIFFLLERMFFPENVRVMSNFVKQSLKQMSSIPTLVQ